MWFLGFSTSSRRSYLIIGAITLVIILTILLRKWALHMEANQGGKASVNKVADQSGSKETSNDTKQPDCKTVHRSSTGIRTYSLEELRVATNDFRIRIGVGATSYVYLAELGDGGYGAVKRVMEERGGSQKMFLDEVSVLLRISHPNLVGLMGFCLEKGEQLLLLEYVPNNSLFDRMHTRQGQSTGTLSWSNRLSIALDIAYALDYLHSVADPPVIHRDIKSSNVLLINDDHAKLADFGLCKLGNDAQSAHTPIAVKGSLGYVDTNYLNTGIVSPKSDVYSFGVLLLELITGLRSLQGSFTLAEWTEECRKSDNEEVLVGMLDPKLKGEANVEQLRALVDVANVALLENTENRPDMAQIAYRISSCMQIQPQP
ncbi:UNVERIFIED_CONTAM: putative leucine-rich repeat receptor-like protein kinase [Sesamum angustifolium]|uniref:non-specific serine/threonine protein kinase n=2 Tax=Sesamum TaxID=4181 RepID=A0AAE2BKV1_9LAMI|nr:putative leucine-rich repeat receptor-like protein kinase [Sesamum angolense]